MAGAACCALFGAFANQGESATEVEDFLRHHRTFGELLALLDVFARDLGQRGVALGWAGLPASRDWRGEPVIVLAGRDGAWRDLGSVHGSYRTVAETDPLREYCVQIKDAGRGA